MSTLIEQRLKEALEKVKRDVDEKGETSKDRMDAVEAWNELMQAKIDAKRTRDAKPVN